MARVVAPEARGVDPITFEILSHRLHQVTKEVGTTLERVGGTVNTTQMQDYMSALYRANGDILSAGETTATHVACASFAVKRIIERFADDDGIYPGDMFLLNDPYVAAIHQSDVYLITPIHDGERLCAWSATFVHVMDIGAMSPGGNSPGATEICHEGVRIPGIKLIERGRLRRDVFDAITNMTRQPSMVALDLKCEIAANNVARSRVQEILTQYGADLVDRVSEEMIRYSEGVLRRRLRGIPDGVWRTTGLIETSETWTVALSLTKVSDQLTFDFTGTDAQAKVGINLPYHATFGSCFGAVLSLLGYDIPKNHGAIAPITVIAPPGCIMNPQYPAPVSLSTTSGGAVAKFLAESVLTQMVAGSEQWRGEVMAKHNGGRRARHAGINQFGRYYVSTFGGLRGGGARADSDGVDSGGLGTTTVHNVEWVEQSFPLLYLFRRHIKDGAGAGRFRGGAAEEVGITVHDAPEGAIKGIAYGVAGGKNSGQGLFGGYPGAPSLLVLHRDTRVQELIEGNTAPIDLNALGGEATVLPYCDFALRTGDVLYLNSASGGGLGDPIEREAASVGRDVMHGIVSVGAALEVYGVVCNQTGLVDESATITIRARLLSERWVSAASLDVSREVSRHSVYPATLTLPRAGGRGQDDATPPPGASGESEGRHSLRENLNVVVDDDESWICCARCGYRLSRAVDDWMQACVRVQHDPSRAGPLTAPLAGQFLLEQHGCPGCGVLLDTDLVEVGA